MNIEDWSDIITEDIRLQILAPSDPPGYYLVATNPYGMAQVGNKLYIVDYDSQKIVILNSTLRGGHRR
jgi:hypothetical protein